MQIAHFVFEKYLLSRQHKNKNMKIMVIENKFLHEIDIIDAEWITKQFGIKNPFLEKSADSTI